jgi:serine protease Do
MRDHLASRFGWGSLAIAAIIGCVVGALLTALAATRPAAVLARPVYARSVAPESEQAFIAAIAKVGPAVVNIDTVFQPQQPQVPEFLKPFFGEPFPRKGQASGVIIDARGYVLTNNHVVQDARSVKVTLADGRSFDATVVGSDPLTDIGVVRIHSDNLPVAELGNSADVPVGGWVLAIGNPFGYENTVTVGVLSARNRQLRAPNRVGLENLLQTDAAINPGNSGGALVDITGKVIGIPTAIIPYAQGIGFAIAAETANKVAEQLIASGHVSHPWLGIYYVSISEEVQKQLKLPDRRGILVVRVEPGGPADQAGIKPRDVILRLGTREITKQDDVSQVVRQSKIGDQLSAAIRREGRELELTVTIGERPAAEATAALPQR